MPKTVFDDRAVDTVLQTAINNTDASPNVDIADITNWPVPPAGQEAIALVGFGAANIEPIRYTGIDAVNGVLTGTSRIASLMTAHAVDEKVIHGGDARFLSLLARYDVAGTFTEDQTIEDGNQLLLGTPASILGRIDFTEWMNNAYWDAAAVAWKRRKATNAASRIIQENNGDLIYYTNSDAGNTVGSTITWAEKFRITKAGVVQLGVDTNLYREAANILATDGSLRIGTETILLGTGNGRIYRRSGGSPEGLVTADPGSLYLRSDGGAGTTLYIKESGTGNTGWVAMSAGGTTKLFETRLSAAASTVSFTSIPQTYKHLRAVIVARHSATATGRNMWLRFNNDSSFNYVRQRLRAEGSTASAQGGSGQAELLVGPVSSSSAANMWSQHDILISDYTQTRAPHALATTRAGEGTTETIEITSGYLNVSSAGVTRLDFLISSDQFVAGSLFALYGVS